MTFLHSYMPGKWKQIATTQMEKHLVTTVEDMRQQAKRWMDTYNFDVIENLVAPPKCVVCGEQAAKRCSKCRQEWYASTLPSSGVVQCASFTVLYSCTVLTVSAMKIWFSPGTADGSAKSNIGASTKPCANYWKSRRRITRPTDNLHRQNDIEHSFTLDCTLSSHFFERFHLITL